MDRERHDLLYGNTTAMAFLGDAVYELYVRERLVRTGQIHGDLLHKAAVRFVCAESQAAAIKKLLDSLSEDELGLVKRARNKKITSKPKHADPVVYKWATAFEALLGFLHLAEEQERLREIMAAAFETVGEKRNEQSR